MNRPITYLCAICIAGVSVASAQAQNAGEHATTATTETTARATPDSIKAVSDQLHDEDPAVVTQAVNQIRRFLQSDPQKSASVLRNVWLKRLLELQRYDDVLDLSLLAILASPSDTVGVEQLQSYRVQSLLAEGKASEALAAAKQLFAVSTMKGTADAIRTICQCLNAVYPDDRDVLKRFRKEQVDGARPDAVSTTGARTMLSSVRVDPAPYESAIRRSTAEDYRSLTGEGNLMLLAGNSKDAWEVFERAYTMASDKELAAASENLARCMKAQDGMIGRANAWVLSIRPKASLASEISPSAATQASHKE